MLADVIDTPSPFAAVQADPFGFWPALRSRIAGLGGDRVGTRAGDDPAYAFHTPYVDLPPGPVRCRLRFTGLAAQAGALTVAINWLDAEGRAETVRSWRLRLGELARDGGEAVLDFEADATRTYAALAHLYDPDPASADALTVTFERGQVRPEETALAAARVDMAARPVFRRAVALLSDAPATLADPVSQSCTAAQFDEPDYARWLDRLRLPPHRHRKQWEYVYILRVLERYGALAPGARGLGFGVGREPIPAMLAAMGCRVTATDLSADDPRAGEWAASAEHGGPDQLRRPDLCDEAAFADRVAFRRVDMGSIPGDLAGYDFCWSSCALEHLGNLRAGTDFVRRSLDCLRPGGLAVHTTELNCTSDGDTVTQGGTVLYRRRDLDRLAIDLVSRGHGVMQLKYDLGDLPQDDHVDLPPYTGDAHLKLALSGYVSTSFGIVVQRGGA